MMTSNRDSRSNKSVCDRIFPSMAHHHTSRPTKGRARVVLWCSWCKIPISLINCELESVFLTLTCVIALFTVKAVAFLERRYLFRSLFNIEQLLHGKTLTILQIIGSFAGPPLEIKLGE